MKFAKTILLHFFTARNIQVPALYLSETSLRRKHFIGITAGVSSFNFIPVNRTQPAYHVIL